jgi:hypothetical protein
MAGPGLKQLRAKPQAEAIRQSVLEDQQNGRREATERMEAETSCWVRVLTDASLKGLKPAPHHSLYSAPTETPGLSFYPPALWLFSLSPETPVL